MDIDWFEVIAKLFAGLTLFLFGLDQIGDGLKRIAGDRMRILLRKLTVNRVAGAFSGATITAILQSSSVTTVLLVGFISAGLMSLEQSVAVIFGANIGSTVTAQIIAFKVTKLGMVMLTVGFLLQFIKRRGQLRDWGALIMGLGLIFFGMELMSQATYPLRSHQGFIDLMASMDNRVLGVLVGTLFTALIQSSAATTGIVIVLASQVVDGAAGPHPLLSLEAGIAIALGANIGTCATAMLAAIGKPREAVRAAVVHVLFNVIGTLVWIGLIEQLIWLVDGLSPGSGPAAAARDVANAHTVFNVINTLVFLPCTGAFAWLALRIVPTAKIAPEAVVARHLDEGFLGTPDLALDAVRLELIHLGEETLALLERVPATVLDGNAAMLDQLEADDDQIDALHRAIIAYCRRLAGFDLSERQTAFLSGDLAIASACESMADITTTNLVAAGRSRLRRSVTISPQTRERIETFHRLIMGDVRQLITALRDADRGVAKAITDRKSQVRELHDALEEHLEQRLLSDDPNRIHAYSLERDLVDNLHRVYYFTKRAAKAVL